MKILATTLIVFGLTVTFGALLFAFDETEAGAFVIAAAGFGVACAVFFGVDVE